MPRPPVVTTEPVDTAEGMAPAGESASGPMAAPGDATNPEERRRDSKETARHNKITPRPDNHEEKARPRKTTAGTARDPSKDRALIVEEQRTNLAFAEKARIHI